MDTKAVDTELEEVGTIDTDGDEEAVLSVYEIGYHLLPTLSEEEVPQVVTKFMDALKAEGAVFVGERFPSLIELAYPIAKRTNSKKTNYESAYFGWVAFEVSRDAILRIKTLLDGHASVLRYLIVTTEKEAVLAAMSGAASAPTGSIEKPKRAAEEGGEVSEAALDQAIETMVTEDAKAAD
ncbi:30S ribosomal protein S6 [Patescibacteria group bacterium]|nr:30S ribosomal protein S6 [Patescibacteria group bacterium]